MTLESDRLIIQFDTWSVQSCVVLYHVTERSAYWGNSATYSTMSIDFHHRVYIIIVYTLWPCPKERNNKHRYNTPANWNRMQRSRAPVERTSILWCMSPARPTPNIRVYSDLYPESITTVSYDPYVSGRPSQPNSRDSQDRDVMSPRCSPLTHSPTVRSGEAKCLRWLYNGRRSRHVEAALHRCHFNIPSIAVDYRGETQPECI